MYAVKLTSAALRVLKKLPKDVQTEIITKATTLKTEPLQGEQLKGKHRFFHSLHLTYKGTAYRIIYQVVAEAETVIVRLADKRENIYKRLDEMKIQ